eukprot:Hpha_TRINITY_DN14644_c0_g1::TRINITY_DN14644_c0_g1_i1::g.48631::m.48631
MDDFRGCAMINLLNALVLFMYAIVVLYLRPFLLGFLFISCVVQAVAQAIGCLLIGIAFAHGNPSSSLVDVGGRLFEFALYMMVAQMGVEVALWLYSLCATKGVKEELEEEFVSVVEMREPAAPEERRTSSAQSPDSGTEVLSPLPTRTPLSLSRHLPGGSEGFASSSTLGSVRGDMLGTPMLKRDQRANSHVRRGRRGEVGFLSPGPPQRGSSQQLSPPSVTVLRSTSGIYTTSHSPRRAGRKRLQLSVPLPRMNSTDVRGCSLDLIGDDLFEEV